MKIKSLKLTNFANYSEVNVSFDSKITYLIGKNGAGKSTIGVNAIWAMFAGIAEKGKTALIGERFRFIGPKAATATGEMVLHDEQANVDITVRRKISKTGNEVTFEAPDDYPVSQKWLEDLFNIFLIAPKKFIELSPKQQAEALGIDPSVYDNEIKKLKEEYTLINRDLTNIGSFEAVEAIERVDVSDLIIQKDKILQFNLSQDQTQFARDQAQQKVNDLQKEHDDIEQQIKDLESKKTGVVIRIQSAKAHINSMPKVEDKKSTSEIDAQIFNASETNSKAMAYKSYLDKAEKKKSIQEKLSENKKAQEAKIAERINYVKDQKLPFDNLEINDAGELLLSGKPIREPYFSTGELIRIVPILMSAKNPDLKYVFIQDFNMLDEDNQNKVEQYLTEQGMQLVIELVGTEKVDNANSILLKDCEVVESYKQVKSKNVL